MVRMRVTRVNSNLVAHISILKFFTQKGNILSAERRMGKEDGGLARHTIECQRSIDWTNAKIVATERGLRQRKVLEGIESLRQKHRGMKVLNSFDHVETWKSILNSFFDRERDCNSQ